MVDVDAATGASIASGVNNVNVNTNSQAQKAEEIKIELNNGSKDALEITVEEGDNLSMLAQRYNTTIDSIKKLNNLVEYNNEIQIGQKLKINPNDASEEVMANRRYNKRIDLEQKYLTDNEIFYPQDRINYFIQKDIKEGRLTKVQNKFLWFELDSYHYEYKPEPFGIEKYKDLKKRYNLPDGVISHYNYIPGGGNFDEAHINRTVKIYYEYIERR